LQQAYTRNRILNARGRRMRIIDPHAKREDAPHA